MANKKIMIVEDDSIQALMIEELLLATGYTIFCITSSGEEAIESLKNGIPDLIILDISLAGKLNGLATYRIINKENNIPVIFLTSYAQDKYIKDASLPGVFGYLLKPFREKELLVNIELALLNSLSNKKLIENNQTKEKVFNIISHDIKNQLLGLKKLSDLFRKNLMKLNPSELEEYCYEMGNTSSNLIQLSNELSDWSSANKNYNPANDSINLLKLIEKTIAIFKFQIKEKKITIINKVPPSFKIHFDEKLLMVVLSNVIANAIKFSFPQSEIRISVNQLENFINIRIEDDGDGIELTRLNKINQGISLENETHPEKGTGIGLSICNYLIKKGGGNIHVESQINIGTSVTIILAQQQNI